MKTNSTARRHGKTNKLKPALLKTTAKVIGGIAILTFAGSVVLHFTGNTLEGTIKHVKTSISSGINSIGNFINETVEHYRANAKASTNKTTSNTINEDGKSVQALDIESSKNDSLNKKVIDHYKNTPTQKDILIDEMVTTGSNKTKDGETQTKVTMSISEQGKFLTTIEEIKPNITGKGDKSNVVTTQIAADTNIKELNSASYIDELKFTFAKKSMTELSNASDKEMQAALQTVSTALLANWENLSSKEQEILGAEETSIKIDSVKRTSSLTVGADAYYNGGVALFGGAINYNIVNEKTGKDAVLISGKFAIDQYGNYAGSALGVSGRITKNVIGYLSANHNLIEGFSGSAGFRITFGKNDNTPALIEVGLKPATKQQGGSPTPTPPPTPSSGIEYESSIPGFVDSQKVDNTNLGMENNTGGNSNIGGNVNQNTNQTYTNNTPNQMNRQSNDNLALN